MSKSPEPSTPLSTRQRLAFTVIMFLIPVLFFVVLEAGLRLANYGDSYPAFVPVQGHAQYLHQNREVSRRYFTQQANVPTSLLDFFHARKPENGLRVFVQGGSSAAGYPFYHGGSFSRMLQRRLQDSFPERHVEVINTAMAAVGSYTLLDLADEIIEQQPDAVLIYAGHNEYYGALGVGSAESLGRLQPVVRSYLKLRRLRTVQLVRNTIASVRSSGKGERPTGTLMARMAAEQTIPYGSDLYELGLRQWRANLSTLLARYGRAGIPVFVATVASNERGHPPFITVFSPGTDEATYRARLAEATRQLETGNAAGAVSILEELTVADTLAAEGFFALGLAYEAEQRADEARTAFVRAKDLDGLRFRAPEAVNRIIREEAARHGALVVDVHGALSRRSPNGVIGDNLMTEHLHPNIEGFFQISDAFYASLYDSGTFGPWPVAIGTEAARSRVYVTEADSLIGMLRVKKLLSSWPFQPREAPPLRLDTLTVRSEFDRIVLNLYEEKTSWYEATTRLATLYEEQGRYDLALEAALNLEQVYPMLAPVHIMTANLYLQKGRIAEADASFTRALARDPGHAYALGMLGAIRLQQGRQDDAIALLRRSLNADPSNQQVMYNLSGAYALSGRTTDARETVTRLLAANPHHDAGRQLLASLPQN
jgi:tetratricopeptide (TPR) repeat protein